MWIEDLTKALYFLNMTECKHYLLIDCIKNNAIYFTNNTMATVQDLADAYDFYISTGEVWSISTLLR